MKLTNFIPLLLLVNMTTQLTAQSNTDPLKVVQRQLDTYNAQDIDAFALVFAEDAEVFSNLGDATPSMVGRDVIRARYGEMFVSNPQNRSILKGRMVQGNFVFDHEWISGRDEAFSIIAIYEVENGLIKRCWFVR